MKGTGAKRNVCPGSCVSTGAKFPVAPVESAPTPGDDAVGYYIHKLYNRWQAGQSMVVCTDAVDSVTYRLVR